MTVPSESTSAYKPGIAGLVSAVQQLSQARDMESIQRIVRRSARAISRAHGVTFVLTEGDECVYIDEDSIAPLWKGMRFPTHACVSGWCILGRAPIVIEDIYSEPKVPHDHYRDTFVQSLVVVPIGIDRPSGSIGAYWASKHRALPEDVELLQALADSTAVALDHVRLLDELEHQVKSRTEEVRRLSLTDELTGLMNRRGFLLKAEQARAMLGRRGDTGLILFADVDGLKAVNDKHGHDAGDRLLRSAAAAMADALREMDVIGRWGGDEFVAFLPSTCDPEAIRDRMLETLANTGDGTLSMAIGSYRVIPQDTRSMEELIAEADAAMYNEKRLRSRNAGERPGDFFVPELD